LLLRTTRLMVLRVTSGIYVRDAERSSKVARKIDAGMIFINHFLRRPVSTPLGASKNGKNSFSIGYLTPLEIAH